MVTTKLYLDTRRSAETKDANPLRINITKDRKTAALPLGVTLSSSQWNKKTEKVVKHPDALLLSHMINQKKMALDTMILRLNDEGKLDGMTSIEIRDMFIKLQTEKKPAKVAAPKKPKENPNTVGKFFKRYIENKELRPRTKEMYEVTWRRIMAWLGEKKANALEFQDINLSWIEDFEKFLSKNAPNPNGRRGHHANLKAVINYAIDHEVALKNPYRGFKIKTKETDHRDLTVEQLRYIIFAKDLEPWMERYRDFFVLSFMLRGLNTVDLCTLGKPVNGRIETLRTKTSQPMSMKIEPEAQSIIDKYHGKELMLDFAECSWYRNFNMRLSKGLKKIRATINKRIPNKEDQLPDFTMYWARHTWATLTEELGFPTELVGVGLGHSQKTVTDIYIRRKHSRIDDVNRVVLDYVLYDIKPKYDMIPTRNVEELPAPALTPVVPLPAPAPEKKKRGRPKKNA